jgi:hypothetical protein
MRTGFPHPTRLPRRVRSPRPRGAVPLEDGAVSDLVETIDRLGLTEQFDTPLGPGVLADLFECGARFHDAETVEDLLAALESWAGSLEILVTFLRERTP